MLTRDQPSRKVYWHKPFCRDQLPTEIQLLPAPKDTELRNRRERGCQCRAQGRRGRRRSGVGVGAAAGSVP